ncbi:MAG: hypothetical protein ACO3SO_01715 [Luteolibacter sp.]
MIHTLLLAVLLPMAYANEHPAEEAEAKLEAAEKNFTTAKKRLDVAILAISHAPKKKEAADALQKLEKGWDQVIENLVSIRIAASPAPDTSTSSSLIPYYTTAEILDMKTKAYTDLAEWIETNWIELERKE